MNAIQRDTAQRIKERVNMADICQKYGYEPNRAGFIRCPFHSGDNTPSLKVNETSWHCFGCGRGGSVIDFVMELFGCSFSEACRRLDADFNLGLYHTPITFTQYRKMQKEQVQRERERIRKIGEEKRRIRLLLAIAETYRWLNSKKDSPIWGTPQRQWDLDYLDRLWDRLEQPGAVSCLDPEGLKNMIHSHYGEGESFD